MHFLNVSMKCNKIRYLRYFQCESFKIKRASRLYYHLQRRKYPHIIGNWVTFIISGISAKCAIIFCLVSPVTFTLSAIPQTTSVAHTVYIYTHIQYVNIHMNILIDLPRSCMSWHLHLNDRCKSIPQKNMGNERFVILWFTITPAWNHANDWSNRRFPAMIKGKEG